MSKLVNLTRLTAGYILCMQINMGYQLFKQQKYTLKKNVTRMYLTGDSKSSTPRKKRFTKMRGFCIVVFTPN